MNAPEQWQVADKFDMTGDEAAEGESLDDKLAAEEPETAPADADGDDSVR